MLYRNCHSLQYTNISTGTTPYYKFHRDWSNRVEDPSPFNLKIKSTYPTRSHCGSLTPTRTRSATGSAASVSHGKLLVVLVAIASGSVLDKPPDSDMPVDATVTAAVMQL
jgi:hypothetical protein